MKLLAHLATQQHDVNGLVAQRKGGTMEKKAVAQEKVTLLACVLGAVASLGGFIFGYVRCVCLGLPRSRVAPDSRAAPERSP